MRVSRGGTRPAVASVVLALASAGTALAQLDDPSVGARAIPAGPFVLYPIASTDVEVTDNLFYNSRNPVSALVFRVTPGILARLPMGQSVFNVGYALQYKTYDGADIDDNVSHFFRADGTFQFGSGFTVAFSEDYQNGVLDTQNFDPGGEVRFLGDSYARNLLEVDLSHGRWGRRVGLATGLARVDFDEQQRQTGLFDTRGLFVRAYGESRRTAWRTLFGEMVFVTTDLSRSLLLPTGDPDDPEVEFQDDREQDGVEVAGGVRMVLSPGSYLQARVAYTDKRFVALAGDLTTENRESTYRGVVGDATFSKSIPGRPRLVVRALRDVYPSIFLDNDYYISNRLSALLESPARLRLRIGGQVTYYMNDYPQSVPRRKDDTLEGRLWLGYRLGSGLEWGVYTRHTSRTSSLPLLGYDATTYGVMLQMGG